MVADIVGQAKRLGVEFLGERGKDLQRLSDLKDFYGELLEEANELVQIEQDTVLFDHVIPKVGDQIRILAEKVRCKE